MTLQDIIKQGLALGLEEVELYVSTSESNSLKLNDGKLNAYNMKEIFGVSIRGLKDGKMGYVYTESLDDDVVMVVLKQLVENVNSLETKEQEFMFAGGAEYQSVPQVKSDYKEHSTQEKIDLLKRINDELLAKSEKIVKVGYCQYSESSQKIQIVNSKGLNLEKSYSYISAVGGALAADNGSTFIGISGDVNTKFSDLEVERIIDEASKSALDQIGAGFVKSGHYPVVLHRDVATSILQAFTQVFQADAALKKLTILTDKIGTKVFGENITIIDDPYYSDALIQTPFDDEGVPCKTKLVVEDGVFNGFLHNLKTANFFKTEPTGNGFKLGVAGGVSTRPTNLFIKEGTKSKDEIIATVEDGLYITDVQGLHAGLNPISGDFNVQSKGFLIKNGKLDQPVTLFVTSGNFYELLNNVEEIGNDIEKRFTGVAAPTLKVKSLAISGK